MLKQWSFKDDLASAEYTREQASARLSVSYDSDDYETRALRTDHEVFELLDLIRTSEIKQLEEVFTSVNVAIETQLPIGDCWDVIPQGLIEDHSKRAWRVQDNRIVITSAKEVFGVETRVDPDIKSDRLIAVQMSRDLLRFQTKMLWDLYDGIVREYLGRYTVQKR